MKPGDSVNVYFIGHDGDIEETNVAYIIEKTKTSLGLRFIDRPEDDSDFYYEKNPSQLRPESWIETNGEAEIKITKT